MKDLVVLKSELISKKKVFEKCRTVNGLVTKKDLDAFKEVSFIEENYTSKEELKSSSKNKRNSFINKVKNVFF